MAIDMAPVPNGEVHAQFSAETWQNPAKIPTPIRIDPLAEAARERAHLKHRVDTGTMAYGIFEGSGTVIAWRDGKYVDINVIAGKPVTEQSIVPHGDFQEGKPVEMVTPLYGPE